MMEASRAPPDIMRLIDQRQGEVLWIDGLNEAWFFLGRPQWASPLQGNPAIFSSALAAEWRKRMQDLMGLRLADQKSLVPLSVPGVRICRDFHERGCGSSACERMRPLG